LGSGDTVILDGQAMTWDVGNLWFDVAVSQASVGLWNYFVNSSTETTYGITLLDTNSKSVDIIWDQIIVQTTVADDIRVNIGDNVEIRVTLWLAYDGTFLGSGDTVTLDGQAMTWDAANSWFDLTMFQISIGLWTYFVNTSSQTSYGITALDTNGQSVGVVWDQIVVQTTLVDDTRINVGANAEIRVTLWLAYDDTFLGSGDTITLAGQVMTWDAGNSWFDLAVSQASVGLWTYFVNSSSDATYGITLLDTNSQSVSVIWDQIVVQTTVADDTRVNIGDNVEVQVTLWLAYDNVFLGLGDSVTLAGQAMTWDAVNSWFDLTVSQVSVGSWSYFVNSTSETAFGITAFNLNSQSVDVIWDQIVVQSTVANDTRVNVGDNVEIRVTLWLAHDNTFLGSGDTVTLAGQVMTWDAVNSWFDLTVSQVSVGSWSYFVNSTSETAFGITAFSINAQSVDVIWDQIVVQTTTADDTRINVGANVEVRVTLWLAYDSSFLGSGDTITLDGQAMTWDAGNSWFDLAVSQASVGLWTYFINSSSESIFGITLLDTNSQSVDIIWDQIVVQTTTADDTRINVGANVEIRVTLWLAYDSSFLGSGDTVTLAGQAMTWDAANSWFDLTVSQATVGLWTYFVNSSTESTYGITLLDTNSLSADIIWDQIVVQTTTADDSHVNIGDSVEIRVTLWLAYDSSGLGSSDIVTLAGQAMTWDAANSWFDLIVSQASVGLWTYFVNTSSQTSYGITALDTNSQSVDIIWDQIVVQTTVADDTRVNVGANVEIRVTLWLAYDSSFLGSGDTVTLDGQAMTWDAANSWFDLTVSQVSVGLWSYFVNSSSDATYGISLLDTNSQFVNIIWDQITVRGYSVLDDRVNINDNVDINVTVEYEYDDTPVTDGTLSINTISATHLSSGIWQITVSESAVVQNIYNTVVCASNSHGISFVNQDSQTQTVTWDRVQVQGYVTSDNRVDVDQTVNINVTLVYDYDDSPVIDGTVTVNGLSAVHQGSGVWLFADIKSSVQLATYNLVVCSGNTYGINVVDQNLQTQDVIWDQVQVQSYSVSDGRVGLNDNVDINITLIYAYDSALVTTGIVTINGLSATHQGSGVWMATDSESTVIANLYDTVACSGNTYGITNVDQNSQSTTVIWDQLVVTIGVDDSTPLNAIQANFTITVIFDYDNAACTTYQIVIQRNGTWWHSFTDANKSLFVDTNSDTSFTYTVRVVTSESTYNVRTFSTNSQQVVWSAAPNAAPVNDVAPVLVNPDDSTYMYARYNYYIITSNVSDADGYTDIEYVELTLYDDSRSSSIWTVRYTVASDTFTIELGSSYIILKASSFALGSGNDLDITWYIKIDWDHSDLVNIDTRQYVDDGIIGVEDFYESNWDVETRLEIIGLSIDDGSGTLDRGPLDGSITVSGTVVFLGSSDNYPLSNETDVWVSSSQYGTTTGPWSDLTLTSGQFSLTAYADDQVGQDTLTIKVVEEAAGSGGTDLLASSTQSTYIADRIQVQSYSSPDSRVNIGDSATVDVELVYEYDTSSVTDGVVTVNGIVATHQGSGIWRISDTKASVQLVTYNTVVYSGGTHGLNQVNQNAMFQEVIWDQIVVQTTIADDTRVNVGANVEIRVTLWLAYDSTFLGAGDSVILNGTAMTWDGVNSWFELSVSQASVGLWQYFVNSSSEATYGITDLDLNSQSINVVWDQIVVQTTVVDVNRLDINANAEIRVTLMLAYDSTYLGATEYDSTYLGATDSVTLDGTAMTWDSVNSWFDLPVSKSSVGAWTYFVNATTDSTYGITSLDLNSHQVQVIWDEIVVQTTVADDTRVNVGDTVEIRVTLMLAYDSTYLGATDSVTLDGTAMTWD
ncbi:MAG: beta strand repeat-containing protein, partial [Candidatus Thorarchaeota archaeon SMTZ1-45]